MPGSERQRKRIERRRSARLTEAAAHAVAESVRAGAEAYDRARDLPKLARLDPRSALTDSLENAAAIVARLASALRAERGRARSGHWTYDLNRHIALRQAFLAETERLAALQRGNAP